MILVDHITGLKGSVEVFIGVVRIATSDIHSLTHDENITSP